MADIANDPWYYWGTQIGPLATKVKNAISTSARKVQVKSAKSTHSILTILKNAASTYPTSTTRRIMDAVFSLAGSGFTLSYTLLILIYIIPSIDWSDSVDDFHVQSTRPTFILMLLAAFISLLGLAYCYRELIRHCQDRSERRTFMERTVLYGAHLILVGVAIWSMIIGSEWHRVLLTSGSSPPGFEPGDESTAFEAAHWMPACAGVAWGGYIVILLGLRLEETETADPDPDLV